MHVSPDSSDIKKLSDDREMLPSNIQTKAKHDNHPDTSGSFTDDRTTGSSGASCWHTAALSPCKELSTNMLCVELKCRKTNDRKVKKMKSALAAAPPASCTVLSMFPQR